MPCTETFGARYRTTRTETDYVSSPLIYGALNSNARPPTHCDSNAEALKASQQRHNKAAKHSSKDRINKEFLAMRLGVGIVILLACLLVELH